MVFDRPVVREGTSIRDRIRGRRRADRTADQELTAIWHISKAVPPQKANNKMTSLKQHVFGTQCIVLGVPITFSQQVMTSMLRQK